MLSIGFIGYATGAVLFFLMGLVLMTGQGGRPRKTMLIVASLASALWLGEVAVELYLTGSPLLYTTVFELVRNLAWIAFLLRVLVSEHPGRGLQIQHYRALLLISAVFVLLLSTMVTDRFLGGSTAQHLLDIDWLIVGCLVIALCGLVLVEQVYRNTRAEARRAIRYLCMGIGGLFVYDFYLYSEAMLFQRVNPPAWAEPQLPPRRH